MEIKNTRLKHTLWNDNQYFVLIVMSTLVHQWQICLHSRSPSFETHDKHKGVFYQLVIDESKNHSDLVVIKMCLELANWWRLVS